MLHTKSNILVLGSASPRRLELLEKIGIIPNKVITANIDESELKKELPNNYVKRVALLKNIEVCNNIINTTTNCFVLTADTVVIKSKKILQKPIDENDAIKMLQILSGGRHKVLTSFVISHIINNTIAKRTQKIITTTVTVKKLTTQEINWYLKTNQWQGKSGAYGIQGAFEVFVKQINGSYSNIIGLPVLQVKNSLFSMGYIPF